MGKMRSVSKEKGFTRIAAVRLSTALLVNTSPINNPEPAVGIQD